MKRHYLESDPAQFYEKAKRCFFALAAFVLTLIPNGAYAGGSGFALEAELQQFIGLISGPFGITVGTLAIIACVFGMIFKSQRGEPFGRLAMSVIGIFTILNIDSIMRFFFGQGALV